MSPSPTPVDQVQTKRMIQRQASLGALSGSARGRSRGGLQRQNSGGSMAERTFRTPSPSPLRQASRPEPVEAPPLPKVPQEYAGPSTAPVKKKKQRASSQEAPPLRVSSPPLTRPDSRGHSLDRFGSSQQLPPIQRNNNPQTGNELQRTDSRNSINFSRPLSPQAQSPVPQPPRAQALVSSNGEQTRPDAVVARAIPPAQAESIQYGLVQSTNRPVKKKKKKVVSGSFEGSHLHTGTMASKPVVTPLEPGLEQEVQPPVQEPRPVKKKKKRAALSGESTHFSGSDTASRTESDSDSSVDRTRERRTQRASGILTKQPSIVREDWEGEQQEASPPQAQQHAEQNVDSIQDVNTPLQYKRPVSAANVSRKIEDPSIQQRVPKDTVLSPEVYANPAIEQEEPSPATSSHLQVTEPQPTRGSSLSPSRSTRFSDRLSSDLAAGRKHEPLPRSVSPAKSALKHHSPASAASSNDPHHQARGSSVTPSESSDISSASIDGPPKQKKSARVSFDAEPEIVGTVATVESMESPSKERKGWLGLGKSKQALTTIPSNDDMEELLKPRPQLPSFGSVRGQKFHDTNDSSTSQTPRSAPETKKSSSVTSSETSSSSYTPCQATGMSNDHAVGAILAQEARKVSQQSDKERSNEPLPPEVTSVEGVVSFSDSESESGMEDTANATPADAEPAGEKDTPQEPESTQSSNQLATSPVELPTQQSEVPVVSVSPPTPATEEPRPDDQYLVEVPGGFPVSAENLSRLNGPREERPNTNERLAITLTQDDETLSEDDSDNDSIYSDAAEDPSELEGTGFGSIDAIVDSPVVAPPLTHLASPPESPLARVSQPAPQDTLRAESMEETQARWSGIVEQTRNALAQSTVEETKKPAPNPASEQPPQRLQPLQPPTPQPKRKRKSTAAIAAAASIPAAVLTAQSTPKASRRPKQSSAHPSGAPSRPEVAAASAAPFRQSMRGSSLPEAEPGFRKSMRNENRNSKASPMVVSQQQRSPQPLASGSPNQPRAALQKKNLPPGAATPAVARAPRTQPIRPVTTNDSDSESSFKKARRSKSTTGGQYTMRRSMRGAPVPTMRGEGRDGVRSNSPVGRRPFSPPEASRTMRASMRGSLDNSVPALGVSTETRRSSSLFGRRQKSPPPVPSTGRLGQNNRSRIVDSDDEDDQPRPRKWHSRFADDSDDEFETPHFAPVRGIPRRGSDDDSTDLEDSSDEDKPRVRAPARLQIPESTAPTTTGETLSPNTAKKRGLFGVFRSKKSKDETPSPVVESPQPHVGTDTSKPSQLGFSSPTERDKIIEQTRLRLEAAREQEQPSARPQTHGKLQRRQGPQRIMSDSWPLPPKIPAAMNDRPNTADGPPYRNGTTRLNQGSMRTAKEPVEPVGRSGKKKRFPMLRKAFGLRD